MVYVVSYKIDESRDPETLSGVFSDKIDAIKAAINVTYKQNLTFYGEEVVPEDIISYFDNKSVVSGNSDEDYIDWLEYLKQGNDTVQKILEKDIPTSTRS